MNGPALHLTSATLTIVTKLALRLGIVGVSEVEGSVLQIFKLVEATQVSNL
jgi:hypothetical protein